MGETILEVRDLVTAFDTEDHGQLVAVDGISLTAASVTLDPDALRAREVEAGGIITIWIIPHTWEVTNLHGRQLGEGVNLEFDVLAKYVEGIVGLD